MVAFSSSGKTLPEMVRIVEVSARDGLQGLSVFVPTETKVQFVEKLAQAGLMSIEVCTFGVNPGIIPQMKDAEQVLKSVQKKEGVSYWPLVPNLRGYTQAREAGAQGVAIFVAATETFSQKNVHCSIERSFERFSPVMEKANHEKVWVRGYLSCCLGCPFEGDVDLRVVADLAERLYKMGCREVVLSDTIGAASPKTVKAMIHLVRERVPIEDLAIHFHGEGESVLSNVYAALEEGISVVDSSVGGLGGCPTVEGGKGNVPTELLVKFLQQRQIHTGVSLKRLEEAKEFIYRAIASLE